MAKPLKRLEIVDTERTRDELGRPAINFGALNQRIGYALRRAQLAVFQDFFEAFADMDIKPAQYSVLTIIESNPGLPQGRVADALGIQKTNFAVMIAGLERRGLVKREISKQDRRVASLSLTADGAKLMRKLHALAQAHEDRIMERLGRQTYEDLFRPLIQIAGS